MYGLYLDIVLIDSAAMPHEGQWRRSCVIWRVVRGGMCTMLPTADSLNFDSVTRAERLGRGVASVKGPSRYRVIVFAAWLDAVRLAPCAHRNKFFVPRKLSREPPHFLRQVRYHRGKHGYRLS